MVIQPMSTGAQSEARPSGLPDGVIVNMNQSQT